MSKVIAMIEAARKNAGLTSDNALAKALDIGRAHISNYRNGTTPEDYVLLRLAVMAGEDPAKAIAEVAAEREKHPERRRWLENFRTAACWVGIALATSFFAMPEKASADQALETVESVKYKLSRFVAQAITSAWNRLASIWKAARPPVNCPGW